MSQAAEKESKSKELIKANFLYGKPNVLKKDMIAKTCSSYINSINRFIELMKNDRRFYKSIFLLDTKSDVVTQFEKNNRDSFLGSAYSQKASHVALDKLHGTFLFIKKKMYGYLKQNRKHLAPFAECTSLLIACLNREDTIEAIRTAIDREYQSIYNAIEKEKVKYREKNNLKEDAEVILDPPTKTKKLAYYQKLEIMINSLSEDDRKNYEEEIRLEFYDRLDSYKTPVVTFSPLPLDSRTCKISTFDKSNLFDYIAEITVAKGIDSKGRIAIPFKTSSRCKKRLHKYKNCQPTICIDKHGNVKLAVPVKIPKATAVKSKKVVIIGADLGIRKIFSLSNGKMFGSFSEMCSKYNTMVEKKLGGRSNLRNTMRKYQKQLRNKNLSEDKKTELRRKIFNIAKNLQGQKRLTKSRNRYNFATCKTMSKAIKDFVAYLKTIKSKVLVVLEDLDIKDFNSGKEVNKSNSMWSRGQIVDRLKQKLDEIGIEYKFVDPAYTSQMCPHCFNIDKNNRSGEQFKCTHCGHEADADTNAGVNIANRVNDKEIADIVEEFGWNQYLKHKKIKEVFNRRHLEYKEKLA